MRKHAEWRRAAVFLLITAAVYLLLALIGREIAAWLTLRGLYTGKLPWALRSILSAAATALLVMLHRRITFRVTTPLRSVLPAMLIGSWLWAYVGDTIMEGFAGLMTDRTRLITQVVLASLWVMTSYGLQRYGFYRAALENT